MLFLSLLNFIYNPISNDNTIQNLSTFNKYKLKFRNNMTHFRLFTNTLTNTLYTQLIKEIDFKSLCFLGLPIFRINTMKIQIILSKKNTIHSHGQSLMRVKSYINLIKFMFLTLNKFLVFVIFIIY